MPSDETRCGFYWNVLKQSAARFTPEEVPNRSAALAFYTVFSLPPMLLIILWTAGFLYEEAVVNEAVFAEIGKLVGEDGARQLMTTVEGLHIEEPNWWATLLVGSSKAANFYEAAGSILVVMLWVYYASIIFLCGALFTSTRANLRRISKAATNTTTS